jgi:putative FmdB family regulatory protein
MPIFEYKCDDCGTKFEKLVRGSDVNGVVCPTCGEQHLTQQLSTFAAHANGGSKAQQVPICPSSGAPCHNPGMCGRN